MDPVAIVFGDIALGGALFAQMLEASLLNSLGIAACASRRLRVLVEVAARSAVLRIWRDAVVSEGETWAAHWALVAAAYRRPEARSALCHVLYTSTQSDAEGCTEVSQRSQLRLADAEDALAVLVGGATDSLLSRRGRAMRVLGERGPKALLPLQRRLLHRLCFQTGALRKAPLLARLNARKAEGTASEQETLLDLAEVLNLRAYVRTYVSGRPDVVAELEEALQAAERASRQGCVAGITSFGLRAPRLLGRTFVSAAYAMALGLLDEFFHERFVKAWGGERAMFCAALEHLESAVSLARTAGKDTCGSVELGTCLASLAECWYCMASAHDCATSAQKSRTIFEEALRVFEQMEPASSVEHADALKDYGKVLALFWREQHSEALSALERSLRLHRILLGEDHPRTLNVVRLMD
eukprot:TRINITY_DN35922_c0_g1_i1.p1 TRINITY_DN35922_c0_g1~~TRINITY_DN35922_c0_g1_i1.p1  ORF type:complete len:479 (+),score=48.31 TRINITY_DN35922_c0_g1_i1:201-1439(+)